MRRIARIYNNAIKSRHHISLYRSYTTAAEETQAKKVDLTSQLKPKDIVALLDRHIVGQQDAKRAVAIALRNRYRRLQLAPELQEDIIPKNILMIGPSGVGKTEIARRLAKIDKAPFIKVEATKFTEVGYHGRDVDQIIRDLLDVAINQTRETFKHEMREKAAVIAEERILDILVGTPRDREHRGEPKDKSSTETSETTPSSSTASSVTSTREKFRAMLRSGELDDREIEIAVPEKKASGFPAFLGRGDGVQVHVEDVQSMFSRLLGVQGRSSKKRMKISVARPIVEEMESEKLVSEEVIVQEAIRAVEQQGIVVIDEIDKICRGKGAHVDGADASAEGVQRDLLPIVEGTTITTKHGNVKTDHILFICSGAFVSVKPSDMLAELQGRLPIRVELKGFTKEDLYRILTEPENNILKQQLAMLSTEQVTLEFTEPAIREIASVAAEANIALDNIGARRLHTVLEKIVEEVSFNAPDMTGQHVVIDDKYVRERVAPFLKKADLSKFII